jgi:hypothetical protein
MSRRQVKKVKDRKHHVSIRSWKPLVKAAKRGRNPARRLATLWRIDPSQLAQLMAELIIQTAKS